MLHRPVETARDNGHSLVGIIVVKKDSPVQSASELDGKTVAFPSPNALGATLLPRAEFDRKFNIKVNELYVKSHSSGIPERTPRQNSSRRRRTKNTIATTIKNSRQSPYPVPNQRSSDTPINGASTRSCVCSGQSQSRFSQTG